MWIPKYSVQDYIRTFLTMLLNEEMLIDPYEHIDAVGEAIGARVAWPISLVFSFSYNFIFLSSRLMRD